MLCRAIKLNQKVGEGYNFDCLLSEIGAFALTVEKQSMSSEKKLQKSASF